MLKTVYSTVINARADSADSYQTALYEQSDLDLHCLILTFQPFKLMMGTFSHS